MKVIRKEDKKSNIYIKNYKIETEDNVEVKTKEYDRLVLSMADGSKPRYANIPENRVKVLNRMHQQYLLNKQEKIRLKKGRSFSITITGASLGFAISQVLLPATICTTPIFAGSIALASLSAVCYVKIVKKYREVEKEECVTSWQNELNSADLENDNVLEGVCDKDKAELKEIKKEKDNVNDNSYFDLSTIDRLSLKTLKRIKANIERENYLGLVRTDEKVTGNAESKGKPYVKK